MDSINPVTSAGLLAVTGMIVSAFFTYFPKLNGGFAKLEPDYQRLIMIGFMAVVAGISYGVSCADWVEVVACNESGALILVKSFVWALIGNQAAYPIFPKPGAVKMAREERALGRG